MLRYLSAAFFIAISLGYGYARAQTPDTIPHLPAKGVEITALRPSDLPTIDARGVEIKPTTTLTSVTGSTVAADALRAMSSSLDIRQYGTLGSIAVPSFRGLPAEYTIVYRDGIRLTNEQLGETDLGQLTLHGISHVELIPASAAILLGGDAIAAAINLVNEVADSALLRIGTEQTSYGAGFPAQSYYAATAVRPVSSLSIVAGGSLDQSNGAFPFYQDTAHTSVLRENNHASLRSADLNALWNASATTLIRVLTDYFYVDRGVPGYGVTPGRGATSLTTNQTDEQGFAALKIDHDDGALHTILDLSYQRQFEGYKDAAYGTDDSTRTTMLGATLYSSSQIGEGLRIFAGAEYLHSSLSGTTNARNTGDTLIDRDRVSAYAASKLSIGSNLAIASSLRFEKISSVPRTELLPQVTLDFEPTEDLRIGGAYSRSFHAPTLNDLYWRILGNPDLVSERGQNWQGSVSYTHSMNVVSYQLGVTVFEASIDNEILWLPSLNGQDRPVNIGNVESKGIELRGQASLTLSRIWSCELEESYTFLDARDRTPNSANYGKELPYTSPTASLFIAQVTNANSGSLATLVRYRGHKFTNAGNDIFIKLQPVTTVDLTLSSREIGIGNVVARVRIGIEDLTNVQYSEEAGYPLPRRTYKFSIELNYH